MSTDSRASEIEGSSGRRRHASDDRAATDVLIVEEYVPEYRRPFFEMLDAALARQSIRLTVAVGSTPDSVAARSDAATDAQFVQHVPSTSLSIGGRRFTFRRLGQVRCDPKLAILDQALRHLENYPLLLRQRRGPKVALWGHGARQAKRASRLEASLERRVTNLAHWFFAYTEVGAERVSAGGFPREHITVTQNTIDVFELIRLREGLSTLERRNARARLCLPEQRVCLYMGALDHSKRIDFLLKAGDLLASRVPAFTLVIAGDGPERRLIEDSRESRPWLRYVGRATAPEKATLGALADLLLVPGSVGLVAVDSLALQTPIVTTAWPYHGPEMDYLENGVNALVTPDSVDEFGKVVERVLLARDELAHLRAGCALAAPRYSLETMVANFTRGIVSALETPRR